MGLNFFMQDLRRVLVGTRSTECAGSKTHLKSRFWAILKKGGSVRCVESDWPSQELVRVSVHPWYEPQPLVLISTCTTSLEAMRPIGTQSAKATDTIAVLND